MTVQGKTVLVTGAGGFIGSHLVEALVAAGARVRALCHYNSLGSRGWLDSAPTDVVDAIDVLMGDVRDLECVRSAVDGSDMVMHLAALIGIPYSYESPGSYVETNIGGTLHLLQAATALGVERVLVTSTSEVYGSARYVPIDESHPRQGQSPYSASKIGADALAEAFFRSFKLPVVTVRPFNTYGPRQSARAVIPTILTQLLSGASELRLGSLEPTRDLTYVSDTVAGFIALADCDEAVGLDVNLGVGEEVSVGDLANMLMDITGVHVPIVSEEARSRPSNSEVERLVSDNSRMRSLTGWKPQVDLRDGLSRTVEWFSDAQNRGRYRLDYTI